jgi:hypothetical protein
MLLARALTLASAVKICLGVFRRLLAAALPLPVSTAQFMKEEDLA